MGHNHSNAQESSDLIYASYSGSEALVAHHRWQIIEGRTDG
jgi:hypothetical protein